MTSRLGLLRLQKLRAGCRASLSRLITLSESSRADHRAEADLILEEVARGRSGNRPRGSDVTAAAAPWTVRIGISGPPGAGKSTLAAAVAGRVNRAQGRECCVVLPMDGFHYSRAQLCALDPPDAASYLPRRGAPWTFDAEALLACLSAAK